MAGAKLNGKENIIDDDYSEFIIYALGDSYTTTSLPYSVTPRTGTYAGGNNWITYFIDVLRILYLHRYNDLEHRIPVLYLRNYARCGNVFWAEGIQRMISKEIGGRSEDLHVIRTGDQNGRNGLDRGSLEAQWEELLVDRIKEVEMHNKRKIKDLEHPRKKRRELYTIWIGVNDLAIIWDYPGVDMNSFLDDFFASYKDFLWHQLIRKASAKEILILNLPPMDRFPDELHATSVEGFNEAARMNAWVHGYNSRLGDLVEGTQAEYRDQQQELKISLVDTWSVFSKILDEPATYGFLDAQSTCGYGRMRNKTGDCSPSCSHMWKDGYHPTEKTQVEVGKEVLRVFLDEIKLDIIKSNLT